MAFQWTEIGRMADGSPVYVAGADVASTTIGTDVTVHVDLAAEAGAPSGDIVDRITAALDIVAEQQNGEPCACGCGRPVDPDGASFYFATDTCQHRWHDRNVDNPEDVYRRLDAAMYPPNQFHNPPPPPAVEPPAERVIIPNDPHGAAYRRTCPGCGQRIAPTVWVAASGIRHCCPTCGVNLPEPAYLSTVHQRQQQLHLELSDGMLRVRRNIGLRELDRFNGGDSSDLLDYIWSVMERQLERFRHRWHSPRSRT